MTIEENVKLIQESILAPAIQTDWQVENGYIPCRIFKNISYGKMGVTNNPTVNKLFNDKINTIYKNNLNSGFSRDTTREHSEVKEKYC